MQNLSTKTSKDFQGLENQGFLAAGRAKSFRKIAVLKEQGLTNDGLVAIKSRCFSSGSVSYSREKHNDTKA